MGELKPDVQALIEHSIKLNTIAWRMAVALGEVPEGATKITADAGGLLDRLLDRLSALSGETEAEWGVFLNFRSEPSFIGSEDSALYFMGRPSGSLDKYAVDTDEKQLARRRKSGEWEVVA